MEMKSSVWKAVVVLAVVTMAAAPAFAQPHGMRGRAAGSARGAGIGMRAAHAGHAAQGVRAQSGAGLLSQLGRQGVGNGRVLEAVRGLAQSYGSGSGYRGHGTFQGHRTGNGYHGRGWDQRYRTGSGYQGYGYASRGARKGYIPGYGLTNRGYYGGYGTGYATPYAPCAVPAPCYDDGYSRAIRDVGLANAAVNLIGIAATAGAYAYPAPVAVQPVVVQPSHYETYQVWVPEVYDPATGARIGGGYYETRTRLVPGTRPYGALQYVPVD